MGILNVHKLTKPQLARLAELHCRHGHSYLDHQSCILTEKPDIDGMTRHLGFFDIESSNLKANFGYTLSYKIWDDDNKKMYGRAVTPLEVRSFAFDSVLIEELVKDLKNFTHLVVYWGKDRRHDLPFVRTRALKADVAFPQYGELGVIDMYDLAKNKLSLHSYRLETVCRELGVPAKGHPLDGDRWCRAMAGNEDALKYIETHNEEDVVCMPPVLYRLEPFYRKLKLSL
jgi:uncharacterized protein YprB with RNaseH-like and TPR domain